MEPRVCVDRVLPHEKLEAAANVAIREATRNLPDPVLLGDFFETNPEASEWFSPKREALVSLTGKRWQTGRTLRWFFMDGPEWAKQSVMKYARFWTNQANLRFVRTETQEASEIRVTFTGDWGGGSWSFLGGDALMIPFSEPTICLGWFLDGGEHHGDHFERRRVVLHEVGHAIGFGHEQSHPEGEIPWDKERAYEWYERTQGWSRKEVDRQVFFRYSLGATNFSQYDPLSIMHYSIPAEFLTDPSRAVGWNTHRSNTDRRQAALWYPRTASQAAEGVLASLTGHLRGLWR